MRTRGFDHLSVNAELLLCLMMDEGVGIVPMDSAKAHHALLNIGTPTWTNLANDLTTLDFNAANPDYIMCGAAACVDLDFTAGDFSLACWFNADALGNRNFMTHGVHNVDGWYWFLGAQGQVSLYTSQAGAFQVTTSANADVVIGQWRFLAATRSGADVRTYANGVDTTAVYGTHVNPATAAARNFYIGVNNGAAAAWLDGTMWKPRIWGRTLTAAEVLSIFEYERVYLGA